jgi:hypothetical protein
MATPAAGIASSKALISETALTAFLYLLIPKHKFVAAAKTGLKSQNNEIEMKWM